MDTAVAVTGPILERLGDPDRDWLRGLLEELEAIHRPSASAGERAAAEWLVARFEELGAEARIEVEPAHGTYWWPLGIGAAAGALAGLAALRGRRLLGAGLGAAATSAVAADFPPHRRPLRSLLRSRDTYNVVCELGPAEAERTVVMVAHHDAPHSGLVFHPAIPETIGKRFPLLFERLDTSPPLMAPVLAGPLLATLGAVSGSRTLARLGVLFGTGSALAMADIGSRDAVPGANDNGTAVVALLALARRFLEEPPEQLRVILLSTGSEESFSEGMKAFGERHFPDLPRESTFFLCLEALGAPHLLVLRGEGFLRMREYPAPMKDLIAESAEQEGVHLRRGLRLTYATDGLIPLRAGYPTASICSVDEYMLPSNYHSPTDTPDRVDYECVAQGVRMVHAATRRLAEWDA